MTGGKFCFQLKTSSEEPANETDLNRKEIRQTFIVGKKKKRKENAASLINKYLRSMR